ncbi:CPBP family intramembrane glutamic endopeptidase [Sphaerisporangium corydalis]|uniref:CPBP family intramembrane glutamic endopeptidase n=1 Tax=Sphaerisporangium corydalis TaxID=1441875 RepID=A0ABV9EM29_9ACTN|nr:CPBP family intramembrane glutamic endopeptidase [Sphaerisporangium corydalis]
MTPTPPPRSGDGAPLLPAVLGVLVAANVLNNRAARRQAPVTSVVAAGTLVALARRSGLSWPELGFTDARRGAAIGGALAGAVAVVYAGGVLFPPARRFLRDERALGLSRARLLEEIAVQVPLGTVLLEEVAFRGVLPAVLRRSYGPVAAVGVSSAVFGLWHVLPALDMAAANPALGHLASAIPPEAAASPESDTPPESGTPPESDALPESGTPPEATALPESHALPGQGVKDAEEPPGRAGSGGEAVRLVAGSVVATGLAGVFFHELRRRGGLVAPALVHLATNSLGFVAARAARRLDRRASARAPRPGRAPSDGAAQAVGTTWKPSA